MELLLFIFGGLTLGFSLLFFLAPQQINKRHIGNIQTGDKPKDKGIEALLNKVISIDERITVEAAAIGIFLLITTVVLFWVGYSLVKR